VLPAPPLRYRFRGFQGCRCGSDAFACTFLAPGGVNGNGGGDTWQDTIDGRFGDVVQGLSPEDSHDG
jgi:hypothetical protein